MSKILHIQLQIYIYYDKLVQVTTELHMDYVEGNLFSLAALLPIMKDSTDELHICLDQDCQFRQINFLKINQNSQFVES